MQGITVSNLESNGLSLSVKTGGQSPHYEVDGWAQDGSVNLEKSLVFTISNTTGSDLNINGVSLLYKTTNKGPKTGQFLWSVDDADPVSYADGALTFTNIGDAYPSSFESFASVSLTAPTLTDNSTLKVFIVGFNASSTGNTSAQIADIRVFTVPEPSSFAFIAGLIVLGFVGSRRI